MTPHTTHTPGPWKAAEGYNKRKGTSYYNVAVFSNGYQVAESRASGQLEAMTNARLIEQAPAMLKLIQSELNYCPFCSHNAPCRVAYHKEARAILAQIEGKE